MSAGKRPPLPLILSANTLLDGDVIYRARDSWTPHLADALVAEDAAAADALTAIKEDVERSGEVVAAELVPVARDGAGRIVPSHYRERIRALGPTVRTDLGPQGQGENSHVSL